MLKELWVKMCMEIGIARDKCTAAGRIEVFSSKEKLGIEIGLES